MSIPLIFVIAIILVTIGLGLYATQKAKTAGDFFVAGRSVGVLMNASAISGEYLSAASFMGVAALVMKSGYDALWYPVGYAAGYLFLLLFIAGPLRRFGAYTIPDFAQGRFDSPAFRRIAVVFVLFIGFFYTMPQMKGAGVVMNSILGWPYYVGILVVGAVITFNVAIGGMKGITVVQAFQYWAKLFAITVPLFVLLNVFGGYNKDLADIRNTAGRSPLIKQEKTVTVKGANAAPANVLKTTADETDLVLPEGATVIVKYDKKVLDEFKAESKPILPATFASQDGSEVRWLENGATVKLGPGTIHLRNYKTTIAGKPAETKDSVEFVTAAKVTIPADSVAPNGPSNEKWSHPFGPMTTKFGYPLLYTYSLIIALVCGTAGLPHILVRFYTNPDGRAAKRTTLWVMVMLGAFYVFTPMWGTLGRVVMPELYVNNGTDSAVIKLPTMLQNHVLGQILSGVTSAGAFAAFMSTFSGLLVSMSGAFAHDIYGKILRPKSTPQDQVRAFKIAAVFVGIISMALGLLVENFDIATMVGWAFAIGAASYFPLLLLGAWWRGLTKYGAAAGMLLGGLLSFAAIVANMMLDKKYLNWDLSPLTRSLMEQPAIWGVPLSIITMIVVSKMTASKIPPDVETKMLRLHAPEEMGLSVDYVA
ncbi:cation acetate symporter [Fimbriimonas ginsengisoli]|uniref:Na+/solute symporter n=1 Tax=Fimbriimonas ginsengisoli Gsoil 348 TaxID=661478 RepID=A0A068NRE7_FIMGI|nr:cation acetate symporter [Fimbriimonas ginsengisoli]AIE85952.1 Na+/solute symporter [Fimbriimonas ginsengisoli Gsoil 348]